MRSRRRNFFVAALAAAIGSLATAGVADAQYTLQGQRLVTEFSVPPLDRKVPGPVNSLVVDLITDYAGTSGIVDKRATRTKLYFPEDGQINTAGIPQCDPATPGLSGTSEAAMALCGPALVGSGSATLVGPVPGVTAKILLFNGTQPNGLPTILFHGRTTAGTTTVLTGTIGPSDIPGFGLVLDTPIPELPLGLAISDFKTTVDKIQLPAAGRSAAASAKGKKKKKKKTTPPQFYLSATCSTGTVNFQAVTTYDGGGAPTTATSSNTCVQKKSKKPRKKPKAKAKKK